MNQQLTPRATPCGSCPYRKDVPSGIWHPEEYAKLPLYDKPTAEQPMGLFMCHCGGGQKVCRGWLDVHDPSELLAVRLAVLQGTLAPETATMTKSPIALFSSGREACDHGMRDVAAPGSQAVAAITKLQQSLRKSRP